MPQTTIFVEVDIQRADLASCTVVRAEIPILRVRHGLYRMRVQRGSLECI